jgi:uncharacterized protein (TIGR02270 family)
MLDVTAASRGDESVLWDVVEEHLDELEFCIEQFESMLDHPLLTLDDLAEGPEARLLAHLDALVIGGAPVVERLLRPAMEELDPSEPARVKAVVLALAAQKEYDLLQAALFHEESGVRAAAVRACRLLDGPDVQGWALRRLTTAKNSRGRAILIDLVAAGGLESALIEESLRSDDAALVTAAARAARHGNPGACLPILESLLESQDAEVRESAMVTALSMGSLNAWAMCERLAADVKTPHALSMVLSAALGSATHHARLAEFAVRRIHGTHPIFALGFSGSPTQVPVLLALLRGSDPLAAKFAAQAFSTIAGIDLGSDAFSVPPSAASPAQEDDDARRALPPLEDEDAELVSPPEAALPDPNVEAIAQHWSNTNAHFEPRTRYEGGLKFGPESALEYLERAPLRRRHALGLAIAIRSRGRVWVDTRAFSWVQRHQLAGARALEMQTLFRPLG